MEGKTTEGLTKIAKNRLRLSMSERNDVSFNSNHVSKWNLEINSPDKIIHHDLVTRRGYFVIAY